MVESLDILLKQYISTVSALSIFYIGYRLLKYLAKFGKRYYLFPPVRFWYSIVYLLFGQRYVTTTEYKTAYAAYPKHAIGVCSVCQQTA